MGKGDIHKKVSGYTVYTAKGKRPVIKTCHQKTGFSGKYFEKTKGNFVKVTTSMVCHKTKKATNDAIKKIDPEKRKVVHTHWAVVNINGKWMVKKCLKSYENKKLVRKYQNGKLVSKTVKCFKSKEDALKRAKKAGEVKKPTSSYKIKGFKGMKKTKVKQIGRRKSAFGVRIGTKKSGFVKTPKGWRKVQPKKVHSGYAIIKTTNGRLLLRKCFKQGRKRVFFDGKKIPTKVRCYRLKSAATKALKKKRAPKKPKKVVKRKVVKRKVVKTRKTAFGNKMSFGRRGMRLNYGFSH